MAENIWVRVNGKPVEVPEGATVAVALLIAGIASRTSVRGEPRSALCGMGVCFECRVTADGAPQRPACQILCRSGMEITAAAETSAA
jgi:predicted molibdopterin-dependent oxidoreductase YjgC